MKKIILLTAIGFIAFFVSANDHKASFQSTGMVNDTPRMKQYWLVMLLKGPNRTHDKATAQRIQTAHLANIDKLWKEGKVVMAGPMGYKYDADLRGIFIMDAKDSATAASYVMTDSAVITGRLRFELHPWWTQTGTYTFK
jgi:uncharacterized protein YciI